jgi:signal transduction histidine kinase
MRLSRDLHDSVGHHLTAISIQLEKAVAYQEISKEDSVEAVNNARQAAGKALQEVRQFISTLKNMHYEFDFNEKTKALIDSFRQENFQVDWEISGNQELYPLHTQRNLYHALQELLTNIQKHAEATRIRINVKFTRKEAILQVEDNGIGFNPRKALRQDGHFGLKHIRERTNLLNGTLEIRADSQNGSTIEICVPRER